MNVRWALVAWGVAGAAVALLVLAPRSSYEPGALLLTHQQLSSNCTACHRPWRGVSNEGCVNCHGDLSDSNPHSGFDVSEQDIGLMPGRNLLVGRSRNLQCLSCHREHLGAKRDVSSDSSFACTWCHKHPAIDRVSEHQVPVMHREFFVRHLFKRRFNHFQHELLIKSHSPPIPGGDQCTSCHMVPPTQPGGHERMGFRWLGCAGVGCHIVPQDGLMEMPESLGRSPTIIPYSDVVPVRHIKAVFVHSDGHLANACEQCHFKIAASRDPDDRASLAIMRCFDCHSHQLTHAAKQRVVPIQNGNGTGRIKQAALRGYRQLPSSLFLVRRRYSEPSALFAQNLRRPVVYHPIGFHKLIDSADPIVARSVTSAKIGAEKMISPPDRGEVRRGSSDIPGILLNAPNLTPEETTADAATPIGIAAGTDERTVVGCNQCHLFHAYGVVPILDFPTPAPKFPPKQLRYFELMVYVPHWERNQRGSSIGPLTLRRQVFSPWWLGLMAIGLVAYSFTRYLRELPQKYELHEAAPDVAPQRSRQVPALDDTYQTNIRHLYIVGEAAGTASINLAMRSGRQVIEAIANELHHSEPQLRPDLYDVVIVGCGPAGLGATATARVMGLKYATLEKLTPASTLRSYPRAKFVQATPIDIAEYGSFFLEGDNSREELIREWEQIISKLGLVINEREEVVGIVRELDYLVVKTARGNSYPSRSVVLAIGVRGNPRRLNLAGEVPERVFYNLIEPNEFTGRKILVVGGGNAGAEVAQALAAARLGNEVSYSFRSPVLANVTPENADAIVSLQTAKRLKIYAATSLAEIRPHSVVLQMVKSTQVASQNFLSQTPIEIENDFIFAMIGAELPTAFLRAIGIKMVDKGRVYG